MATVPRAPRHILYILVALVSGAAAGPTSACSIRDDAEQDSPVAPAPVSTASTASPGWSTSSSDRTDQTGTAAPPPAESEPATTDLAPSGFRLDEPDVDSETPRRPARGRKGRPIEIVLRSSPPGAVAAVDGVTVGPTPALWQGAADASPREFTFVLPGYAVARYRFVPMRSGIVHATLEPIKAKQAPSREKSGRKPRAEAPPGPK